MVTLKMEGVWCGYIKDGGGAMYSNGYWPV